MRAICPLLLACTVPAASCLALAPPLNGGTLVEAFLLHVLKQARLGDLPVELLQHYFQPVGLVQRDFHRPIRGERLEPETKPGPQAAAPGSPSLPLLPRPLQ